MYLRISRLCFALLLLASAAGAGEADVTAAEIVCGSARVCSVAATIRHADAGPEHYADRFEVLTGTDRVLAVRPLLHPHVAEQPFTRMLRAMRFPEGVETVRIRAHDSVHGYGGAEIELPVPSAGATSRAP